jgi:hypothetical protein
MKTVTTVNGKPPVRGLGLKLTLLFLGTFLGVLALIVIWTLFANLVEGRRATDEAEIQTPAFTIDPKIETDLAKAMTFDAVPASAEVQNPFIDRANIGTNITVTQAATNAIANNASNPATANAGASRTTNVPGVRLLNSTVMAPEVDNTKQRYEDWLSRERAGYLVGLESETLGVDDLVPVGYADGGDRGVEVILYSISLCKTFSYPVGTQFYNGVLNSISSQEVVFAVQNGIRRKSYSVIQPCGGNSAGGGEQN